MAARSRTTLGRRLGVLVAGAVVVTSLTAAAAQASAPTPAESARDTGRPPPGYVLERGRFTPVVVPPGVEDPSALGIGPTGLNDRGQIVGIYDDVAADAGRGFLLDRGRFATVHVPGAMSTQVWGINNRGQIVGAYADPAGAPRGFLLDRGRFTKIDVPGAQATVPFGINDRGQIVGISLSGPPTAPTPSGFLRDTRGRFTAINRPGAMETGAFDINNRGQIAIVAPDPPPSPQPTGTPPMGRMA